MVRLFVSSFAVLALAGAGATPLSGQSTSLVPAGGTWRYLADGSDQGTAWRAPAFNDAWWTTGPAQLGYGDGDEATVVAYGANASAKHITTYFRRTFSVPNPADFGSVSLRMLRDDGAVVYVNGSEVFRTNLPAGAISHTTPASAAMVGVDESAFVSAALSPTVLAAGSNVIAVEVHQSDPASSDLGFDLELLGRPSGNLTRGPYLQLGTPTSIVVRWRTGAPSGRPRAVRAVTWRGLRVCSGDVRAYGARGASHGAHSRLHLLLLHRNAHDDDRRRRDVSIQDVTGRDHGAAAAGVGARRLGHRGRERPGGT
jgi:hypothetical protein